MNKYTLKELTTNLIDGKHGGCNECFGSGYYFISVKDLDNYKINYDNAKEISKEDFLQCDKRTRLEVGDTIYANSGDTIGKSVYIKNYEKVSFTTFQKSVAILKPNCDLIIPRYLYYTLRFETPRLRKLASGSAQKNLLLDTMKKFVVEIPPKEMQVKILSYLEPIDDLIEKNMVEINNIENYINKIYHSWFINYNFPTDKGSGYFESNGPLKYDEILKRDIPIDWKVETLYSNSLSSILKPGIDKFEDEKCYLATGNVINGNLEDGNAITFYNREGRANMQPILNSVWFAKMKNSIKHITIPSNSEWFVRKYILSTGFVGIKCDEVSISYIHSFINSPKFEIIKNYLSHGATQQAINNEDLKTIPLLIPSPHVLSEYAKIVNPLLLYKMELKKINIDLQMLEKQMLPTLMKKSKVE